MAATFGTWLSAVGKLILDLFKKWTFRNDVTIATDFGFENSDLRGRDIARNDNRAYTDRNGQT
jgi:hypothetical protein